MLAVVTSHPIQYQVPLWRALSANGTNFRVWYLTDHGVSLSLDREFGVKFKWDIDLQSGYSHEFLNLRMPIDMSRFRGVVLEENLATRIQSQNVTHLMVEGWRYQAFWQAIKSAKQQGIHVILRGETNAIGRRGIAKRVARRLLLRPLLSKVDSFLCIGTQNRRFYERQGISTSRLHSAPYSVDNDLFAKSAAELRSKRNLLRSNWGISQDALVVLFCGKFIDKKHPMHLIKAAKLLKARNPKIHLLFVGGGEQGDSLRRSLNVVFDHEKGGLQESPVDSVAPRASFTGFLNQSQISQAYVAADLLVLPSDQGETWGLVVNEAMASGLPAIVSDQVGCAVDLPAALDPMFVFRFGDIDALAISIEHCARMSYSQEAIQRIAGKFHLMHTVSTIEKIVYGRSFGEPF
ncbi:MAG: glycosyltransferase family 4 protein [Planctomycetes bacterium]|nr:glycosyltransferase family 4 protein [Planctomycetota bacterium]